MTDTVEITITIPAPPEGYEVVTETPIPPYIAWNKSNGWKAADAQSLAHVYAYAVKKKPVKHSIWVALYASGASVLINSRTLEIAKSTYPHADEYREITWEVSA